MKNRVGLLCDERYLRHQTSRRSLENPERVRILNARLHDRYRERCTFIKPRQATIAEIEQVHSRFYLEQLREHTVHPDPFSYDPDTYLMEESLDVALLSAGGCLSVAEAILAGTAGCGFAVVRPPGHHAEAGRGMGFCVLNNVAVTAQYLIDRYQMNRILIIDFDVHHGNGTQEIFYERDEVLFLSLHQRDLFPATGKAAETGKDRGAGYTFNMEAGPQFGDMEYTYLLGKVLQGVVEQFLPQMILVSAGYDGHAEDPISLTRLSSGWFGKAAAMLQQYAMDVCEGRLLFILEGGYNPASLVAGVEATIDSLLAPRNGRVGVAFSERAEAILRNHPLRHKWHIE